MTFWKNCVNSKGDNHFHSKQQLFSSKTVLSNNHNCVQFVKIEQIHKMKPSSFSCCPAIFVYLSYDEITIFLEDLNS